MHLIDTTLREGLQRYGVYLDLEQKKEVLRRIADIGVEEMEIGVVGRDDCAVPLYEWAWNTLECRLSVWCPCREADVRLASRLMPERLSIGVPVSDVHLEKRLGIDRTGLLRQLGSVLELVGTQGFPFVSLGLEDLSRADPEFALQVADMAVEHGVSRIRLADTVGIWHPGDAAAWVRRFKSELDAEIAVHCHNDFGMATANTVTALLSGADGADVSVLGLGERAGVAALEEVAAYARFHMDATCYRVDRLKDLSGWLAELTGTGLSAHRPVVGERLFYCESGLHVDGQIKVPDLYDPFPPETVGLTRRLALGGKSGLGAVRGLLRQLGFAPRTGTEALTGLVRRLAQSKGAPLNVEDLRNLCH